LNSVQEELVDFDEKIQDLGQNARGFGNPDAINKAVRNVDEIKLTVNNMKSLWNHIGHCKSRFDSFMSCKWLEIAPYEMEDEVKKLQKSLREIKVDKKSEAYRGIFDELKTWVNFIPLITDLSDKDMRDRHWDDLKKKINVQFTIDDKLLLRHVFELKLGDHAEEIEEITDQAKQEAKMQKTLAKLEESWKDVEFVFKPHKDSGVHLISLGEDEQDMLDEQQQSANAMTTSRYLSTFETEVTYWIKALANVQEIVGMVSEVQRTWTFLENLFIHSDEVKKELPKESEKFIGIDKQVRDIFTEGF
jgi:dynein heavy chain